VNKSALALLLVALSGPVCAAASFDGVWRIKTPVVQLRASDGTAPPLKADALRVYQARSAQLKSGDRSFDSTLRCKPMGEPRTSFDAEGGPFEIMVNPKMVVFAHTWNRMIRFVPVSAEAPAPIGPTYYGTATARWQKDELVIDARAFHDSTLLDASGMPHSDQLRLTERFRLKNNGAELEERVRIDDPMVFTRSWEATLIYQRLPGARIAEDVCVERLGITDY
jgi:hypothetical protein